MQATNHEASKLEIVFFCNKKLNHITVVSGSTSRHALAEQRQQRVSRASMPLQLLLNTSTQCKTAFLPSLQLLYPELTSTLAPHEHCTLYI
jgi:hypothetical protein